MHRVDNATAAAVIPATQPVGTPGFFTPGDPGTGVPATVAGYDWFNTIQEELANVVTTAGLALDKNDRTQVATAINALIVAAAPNVTKDRVFAEGQTFASGVADGEVVYWDSVNARFDQAIADGTVAQWAVGIADVTASEVTFFGTHETGLSGLTVGPVYLSTDTAGAISSTTSKVKLGHATAANKVVVDIDAAPATPASYRITNTAASTTISIACSAGGNDVSGGGITVDLPTRGKIRLTVVEAEFDSPGGGTVSYAPGVEVNGSSYFGQVNDSGGSTCYVPLIQSASSASANPVISGGVWTFNGGYSSVQTLILDIEERGMATGLQNLRVKYGHSVASYGTVNPGALLAGVGNPAVFIIEIIPES